MLQANAITARHLSAALIAESITDAPAKAARHEIVVLRLGYPRANYQDGFRQKPARIWVYCHQ